MKLRYAATSPFVRRVVVTAIECGLDDQIERIDTSVWDPATDIAKDNPLGKVPALVTAEGLTLCDSATICLYLDSLAPSVAIVPGEAPRRWQALNMAALNQGMMEAAVARNIERRVRPEAMRWDGWHEIQKRKVDAVCNSMEREAEARQLDNLDIGTISLGCALGYLDLRFSDEDWRQGRPALSAWYEEFSQRPSMQETVPVP